MGEHCTERVILEMVRRPIHSSWRGTYLLQEGEDLHTFCSAVHHYGIAWTPSSMEQRVGRIDRVRSQSDRRAVGAGRRPRRC